MEKFTTHTGVAAPLRHSNVDTDQIIPAEYLKRITRTGYEDARRCRKFNNLVSRLFAVVFRSDRPACIARIKAVGREAYQGVSGLCRTVRVISVSVAHIDSRGEFAA